MIMNDQMLQLFEINDRSPFACWFFITCFMKHASFKGTIMQIRKSLYMFAFKQNQYPENFPFLILRILELFAREVCKFFKKQASFQDFLLFLNVCKQSFHIISRVHISKSKMCFNVKFWTYHFHIKAKILADF